MKIKLTAEKLRTIAEVIEANHKHDPTNLPTAIIELKESLSHSGMSDVVRITQPNDRPGVKPLFVGY